uniref:C-type lectin domain-containing protein n=1 Tax=Anolis carolinensis TaxID=28377 RepID=A0A803SZS2_ANOCA
MGIPDRKQSGPANTSQQRIPPGRKQPGFEAARLFNANQGDQLQHSHLPPTDKTLTLNGKIVITGDKLFATTEKTVDFDGTVKICKAAHGSIASPKNAKENAAVLSFVKQFNTYAYLGITEGHIPGYFNYLTGKPLNFTNWYENEPMGKGTEKCVEMYTDGTWNDKVCSYSRLTVCEF